MNYMIKASHYALKSSDLISRVRSSDWLKMSADFSWKSSGQLSWSSDQLSGGLRFAE